MQRLDHASDRHAILLMFQATDAAGKDGAIRHVMSGVIPQGCRVYSFKQPTETEVEHDFLWRTSRDVSVWVIPTNEELMIAQHTVTLVRP